MSLGYTGSSRNFPEPRGELLPEWIVIVLLIRPKCNNVEPGEARRYWAVQPPSMTSSLPVTNADSSDAR